MTSYVFPGQGSQIKGMGDQLFNHYQDIVHKADNILGYSITKLCLEDPEGLLNNTEYTQPALYVVNALSYLKKLEEIQTPPNYLAGHSLGEYNALLAAGVFDFETGLKLVKKRGALMSQASGGGMAAVVGLNAENVLSVLEKNHIDGVSVANYNSHLQIVISGSKDMIKAAEPIFVKSGAMLYMPLKVSGAFHSPYMNQAQQEFCDFLKDFTFSPPKIPVIANVDAKPYEPNKIKDNLTHQINHSVLWTQSISYLLAKGETVFQEIGPGKVLTGLISRIQKDQ